MATRFDTPLRPDAVNWNPLAAAQLLGHKDYSITMAAYIKQDRKALVDGAKALETRLNGE